MRRRNFLTTSVLATAGVLATRGGWAMGEQTRFKVGMLSWGEGWNTRPTALRRMLQEVEKRTSVEVASPPQGGVALGPDIFGYPMLFMSGERGFEPWSDTKLDMMRQWLKAGGFLVVDSSEGVVDGPFLRSVRRELARIYPGEQEQRLPSEHVLYKSFYLIKQPLGRLKVEPHLGAFVEGDRVPVILSANDMLGAWARDGFGRWEYDVIPGGQPQRERSFRLGVNLAMYALCVNYKEDQVHIPFILKRRQWKVDF